MHDTRKLAYLALVGTAIIWGAALPVSKPALSYLTPAQFLLVRFFLATIITLPLLLNYLIRHQINLGNIKTIIGIELFNLFYLLLLYIGVARISALHASLLGNTRPVIITLMGILFLKETEEIHEALGLTIALIGAGFLVMYPFLHQSTLSPEISFQGSALVIASIGISAVYTYLVKTHYRAISKPLIQAINAPLGLCFFFALTLLFPSQPITLASLSQPTVIFAIIFMGIFATPIAFGLRNFGFSKIEASEATLFDYLQPLIYIPLSVIWLGDQLYPFELISLMLIVSGVFLAEYRFKRHSAWKKPLVAHGHLTHDP